MKPKETAMSQIVADAELARQIEAATGGFAIVNEAGTTIALCVPLKPQKSSYTPEEIEHRRKDLAKVREEVRKHPERCKSLKEIMANLERLAGESQ
jgi:hypothetical protein